MTDNKSLTYLMQLEENTKSEFTEVKNKIDSIDLSISDLSSITSTISDMQGSILSMKNSVDTLFSTVNDTNSIVKDILDGTQINAWISDLASSGKSSATYKDSSRMTELISNANATQNITISSYLLDWSIENNKLGNYYSSCVGSVSGLDWNSLTTPASICSNSKAFSSIVTNETAFSSSVKNQTFRQSVFSNVNTCESIINGSSIAKNVLVSMQQEVTPDSTYTGSSNDYQALFQKNMYVISVAARTDYSSAYSITANVKLDNTTRDKVSTSNKSTFKNVYLFADQVYRGGYSGSMSDPFTVRYVDFS